MDPEALAAVRTIVSHDECADGTASAILLHDALPRAEVVFAEYGAAADRLVPRQGMLFCDFSPPAARVDDFVAAGAIVLDHHRSARRTVERFGALGVFGDERAEPGVSGAVLAYRHVWAPLRSGAPEQPFAAWFASAAGARDTWQTSSPRWHDGCVQNALLTAFDHRFWLATSLAELARDWGERYAWVGEQLVARDRDRLQRAIAAAHRFTTPRGLRGIAIEGLAFASDAAEQLAPQVDVVIAFGFAEQAGVPVMHVSLRSHAGLDCAAFAQRFGGGGHTRAAGFAVPLADTHPFRVIERLFDDAPTA
jgi:oligoribonuclease NrnB/cAMP/cGMP phosphodiesterase (DHH superfamily)